MRTGVTEYWAFEAGDLISVHSGGGGRWGDPRDREPERVAADVVDGYVTPEAAREIYGVAVVRDRHRWLVDRAATADMRSTRTPS